jgi:hypothetical protein
LDPDSAAKDVAVLAARAGLQVLLVEKEVSMAPVFIALVTPFELSTGVRDALM